jgi:hypothetical protein
MLLDVSFHSEHGKVIQSNFKLGSVERSIDLDKEGIPQQRQIPPPIKIDKFYKFQAK